VEAGLRYHGLGQSYHFLQVGKKLERVADRTTNICEWVVFAATGVMKELNRTGNKFPLDDR